MNEKFLQPYNPEETEKTIYQKWEDGGLFNPDKCIEKGVCEKDAEPFSIVLPPPNVTGILHLGHATMLAIEDIMVRFARMQGKRTLWIPGTDHAAIATQAKVEKILQKEGVRKHELGREKFLERVQQYALESQSIIIGQIKNMGSSVDWSRLAFTLDEQREKAVRTAFKQMYEDGLIYRKDRVVNWDPKGQTTVSDDEVNHEEQEAILYTFKYSADFPISIATTRPETKVGDVAVAVHPEDVRYKEYIGKTYEVKFAGSSLSIKVISDGSIDPEFGTGAVGITPAHSQTDWDIADRHNLPLKQVINEYAKMELGNELLDGKKTTEAREVIVDWLKEHNLLEKEEKITNNISTAERTGGVIEPLPKLQWFIDVNKTFTLKHSELKDFKAGDVVTLKQLMKSAVDSEEIHILPNRFEKIYHNWVDNLRDWCISRQIWYGHQIPVWYKDQEIHVGLEAPEGDGWQQDPDTLDTWFSSGLWTFSTLGWPFDDAQGKPTLLKDGSVNPDSELGIYHPTTILETGYDIIFFWVARMILMSTYLLGQVPFKTTYLHGMVRDMKGQKMSKSKDNGIDPNDMIHKYGADAVRMSLIIGTGPGNDIKLGEDKIRAYKKFANKIWNATRFVLERTEGTTLDNLELSTADQKLIDTWRESLADITSDMDNYRFYLAGEKLYHYFWHTFADVIIEDLKKRLEENPDDTSAKQTLLLLLTEQLKSLHPFMPFITEEIWQNIHDDDTMIMVQKWPKL